MFLALVTWIYVTEWQLWTETHQEKNGETITLLVKLAYDFVSQLMFISDSEECQATLT